MADQKAKDGQRKDRFARRMSVFGGERNTRAETRLIVAGTTSLATAHGLEALTSTVGRNRGRRGWGTRGEGLLGWQDANLVEGG